MSNHYDVLIAGGGMVGSTLACALGGSSLKVGIIEPQRASPSADETDLRVSAITLAAQTVFENIGAWAGMRAQRASPVAAMRVWEGDGVLNKEAVPATINFDSADIGEACLAWIIENRVVVAALAERLQQCANITLLSSAQVSTLQVEEETVVVRLADGRTLSASLLVGADGAESCVRREARIDWIRHDLAQSAIVATVHTEVPHAATARQHFLATGPLAFLPLAEPHSVSIVWSADSARAGELMALDDSAFNAELQAASDDSLGALRLASRRIAIPLALGFARDYTAHRIALIGDAAHTVHPLAGQGVNLGILDAAALAGILLAVSGAKRDPGAHARLRRYERARKGADLEMQALTGGLRYLFGSNLPGVQRLRDAGLRLTERLPVLKNFFMRRASGLAGELPPLAQRVRR